MGFGEKISEMLIFIIDITVILGYHICEVIRMTFGERLADYITKSGLSQKQLADKIGVTPTRLNYWVKDKREPDVFHIKALAKALGVTGDELLGTEDVENQQNGNAEFTADEIAWMIAIRDLDAPGKAVMKAVLESQQQRIREYGSIEK